MQEKEKLETTELVLDHTQLADLELLVNNAYAPVNGFLTRDQYLASIDNRARDNGISWQSPIVLGITEEVASSVSVTGKLTLVHPEGIPLAEISQPEIWESNHVSPDYQHYIGGPLKQLSDPVHYDFPKLRLSPEQYLAKIDLDSAPNVLCFSSDAPIGPAEVNALIDLAAKTESRILLAPVTAPDLGWNRRQFDLVRSYSATLSKFGNTPVDLVLVPAAHVIGNGQGQNLRNVVLANYGCTEIITPAELSSIPSTNMTKSGFDEEFPEVREILSKSSPPPSRRGFTVFFTGLPSSGKSTLANYLVGQLMNDGGRSVTLLDGDIVRRHLSSELGFSRHDRDTNIRRIGYVASEITKAGGIAICAPIAPYDSVRREVRNLVSEHGDFVEVYVSTPIEVCEERDRKGLYAKARAGIISNFTGIDDPYEIPRTPEIVIDTSETSSADTVNLLLDLLIELGLIGDR
jgi:sulfate adenylyltransferase